MATVIRELTIVALHGDTDRDQVQKTLDEKSARLPPKDWPPGTPHNHQLHPCLAKEEWPEASCFCTIVGRSDAEPDNHVDLVVRNFTEAAGFKMGQKIRVTVESVD